MVADLRRDLPPHSSSSSGIEPWQRFTKRTRDCPVCGGNADDRPNRGIRCWGYISQDERFAYCTREESAGTLDQRRDGTYKHRISGDAACRCGLPHGMLPPIPIPHAPPVKHVAPKVYTAIPDWLPGMDGYRRITTYDYRDVAGVPLYTIARYEHIDKQTGKRDKEIRPFCPVPDGGGWVMRRADTAVLYRLPDIHAADPWAPVYICEGEKDADRLAAGGLIATTNAFGASSWHMVTDVAEHLAGRHVVILEDNDADGRKRTEAVAESLANTAASLRVVRFPDLPDGGDVSDWLDAGHTLGELHRHAATLPVWMPQTQDSCPATQDASSDHAPITCLSCARLRDQLRIAETSLENLRRERALESQYLAIPNEKMSAPTKLAAIAVRRELVEGSHEYNNRGHANIPRAFIARRMGVKEQAAGAHLIKLERQQVIARDERKSFDETTIYIGRGALFDTPAAVDTPARANTWGGARKPRCTACNSTSLKPHTFVCEECGTISTAAEAIAAGVTYDLEQAAATADLEADTSPQTQDSCPATQDASSDSTARIVGETSDAQTATQDHSPAPDLRVNDLVSPDGGPPPCPDCGGPTYRQGALGWLICQREARRVDRVTMEAS